MPQTFDTVVVGGGPSGATAAAELARRGRSVLLLDRAGRIKPCGGAIPPRAIDEFAIPDSLLVARAAGARIISPKDRQVAMPIEDGFVGMVDREHFDEWLRTRAVAAGAERLSGTFEHLDRDPDGTAVIHYRPRTGGAAQGPARVPPGELGRPLPRQACPASVQPADQRCRSLAAPPPVAPGGAGIRGAVLA